MYFEKLDTVVTSTFDFVRFDGGVSRSTSSATTYNNAFPDPDVFTANMVNRIHDKFGQSGYLIKAFIHDQVKDQGLCALDAGSYGEGYKNFISATGNPYSGYESICSPDYIFSLDTTAQLMIDRLNSTYVFDEMVSGEKITGVSLIRSGNGVLLLPLDYEVIGNKVIFADGTLQVGDEIVVTLEPI